MRALAMTSARPERSEQPLRYASVMTTMPEPTPSHGQCAGLIEPNRKVARPGPLRLSLGVLGIAVATTFLVWLLLGWVGWMPTLVDVFGTEGLRTPAGITVAALLIAAVAFWEC